MYILDLSEHVSHQSPFFFFELANVAVKIILPAPRSVQVLEERALRTPKNAKEVALGTSTYFAANKRKKGGMHQDHRCRDLPAPADSSWLGA